MAAQLLWGIQLALRARAFLCISRTDSPNADWRLCASVAAWVALSSWSVLEPKNGMNNLPLNEILGPLEPAWEPTIDFIGTTNIAWLMQRAGVDSYEVLHQWSVQKREDFWATVIERLGIRFQKPFSRVLDLAGGVENPRWLVDAQFNI